MHAVPLGNPDDYRVLDVRRVFRRAVALGTCGRADGAVADRAEFRVDDKLKNSGCWKCGCSSISFTAGLIARRAAPAPASGSSCSTCRCAAPAPVHQLLHLAPRLHVVFVDVGPGVGRCASHVAAGRMKVRERPVHQIEIQVVEPQVGERLAAGGDHIGFGVLVVPQLRGDPEFLALTPPRRISRATADLGLVAVDRRAIEMPVADRGRAPTASAISLGETVGAEGAQPEAGILAPVKSVRFGITTGSIGASGAAGEGAAGAGCIMPDLPYANKS